MSSPGTLYIVATPIGNLEDLTHRAERILGEVGHVAAEDTRRTGLLLKHLGIRTDLLSLHAHNEAGRVETVLGWLAAGECVALVTDAGTPLVSDPGERLATAVADAGHPVVPVPGPSAVLAALAGSGLPAGRFAFLGFLPRKGREREDALDRVENSAETSVLFESPERLVRTLQELAERGVGERRATVARELTKVHEEFRRGTVTELAAYYAGNRPRGEVTLVVAPSPAGDEAQEPEELRGRARNLLAEGVRPSRAARILARERGVTRNEAYALVQELTRESEGGEA